MTQVKFKLDDLKVLEAKSNTQQQAIEAYNRGSNLVLSGSAGSGKTYLALRLAIESVLDGDFKKLILARSIVPTRNIGFLPGTEEEKQAVYLQPYVQMFGEIFGSRSAWERLTAANQVVFENTCHLRGLNWRNSMIVVDEAQNLTFHELDTVITRLGEGSSIIFAGDWYQTDLVGREQSGLQKFVSVLQGIDSFECFEFTWKDIVRSDLVRRYIIAKEKMIKDGKLVL